MCDYSNKYDYLELRTLPRLPIPELEETLKKYLETVEVLVTEKEFQETKKKVDSFLHGKGPALHQELKELALKTPTSWLEGFWDTMYMELRCPNTIHVNPCFGFKTDPKRGTQAVRAAALTRGVAHFHLKIASGKKSPDMERDTPLCMTQYGKLLCATRIPKQGRDVLVNVKHSDHVIVISNNQFYQMDVIQNGTVLSEGKLAGLIQNIITDSLSRKAPAIGALTNEDRNVWASAREHLLLSQVNAKSLRTIEEGIFALVLDHTSPKNRTELAKELLHGDGRNRWFDKSIQVIVAPNADAGINMEHSGFDGHTILGVAEELMKEWESSNVEKVIESKDTIFPLSWELSETSLKNIKNAESNIDQFISETDTFEFDFEDFGKNYATSHKFSPDAFIQIAYQAAFYRLKGFPGSTYESSNTKRFYHGRTETIRSCTKDAAIFSKYFADSKVLSKDKFNAFKKACETHVKVSNECKIGKGHDRHLYGMHNLAKHNVQRLPNYGVPDLYTDKSYGVMKTDLMSTSNCSGTNALNMFGFGPVCENGFGLGYIVEDKAFRVTVTSFKGEAQAYAKALKSTLHDLKALIDENCKLKSKM
jgi:carnitine O-acetyltransferase